MKTFFEPIIYFMPRRRSFSFPVIDPLLADPWQLMVDRSKYGIVNILFTIVRCFDMENTVGEFHASGFIVDIEHGIILSNRHVVGSGPITAKVRYSN